MSGGAGAAAIALNVSDLSFAFAGAGAQPGGIPVLSGVDLRVARGEIVSILGASGCGKSTLLNLIAGLLPPDRGRVEIGGGNTRRGAIGYIFQDDALFPWRTVEGNLMLASEIARNGSRESARGQIRAYLHSFHLAEDVLGRYPAELSGGMRQRVSIIQSLMFDPELILLDEPFSALDFYTKLRLETEFRQLIKERDKAAVFVTHDIEEAVAVSDRVLIMARGGSLTREFVIDLDSGDNAGNARGTPRFAELYSAIWTELSAVIAE
jgi:NitT/TauT family transport system ATP-binding protein